MLATDVIRRKRDGQSLSDSDIRDFLSAYTRGDVADYQMAALAMAVFFRGLDERELATWTRSMLESGDVLDLSAIPGRKVDKHSTGGVGDKISLPLAPIVAACGVRVPMISGRGLGHTGGTLDKLESIPGFGVRLSPERFTELVASVGLALGGQTGRITPTDGKLYALRDVTSTVDSIPLIASSIMSKKLAEGIDALVLDVKFGSGAFMRERARARQLALTMCRIGRSFGRDVVAYLTSMEQPLGTAVGNALEIIESVEILQGGGPSDTRELTRVLAARMLVLGQVAADMDAGLSLVDESIRSGAALRKFEQIVEAQGGDPRALTDHTRLPRARHAVDVVAAEDGFVSAIQTDEVGWAALMLGAGRQRVDAAIDPAVGFVLLRRLGDRVEKGQPLARILYNDPALLGPAQTRLAAAYRIGTEPVEVPPLIAECLTADTAD